MADPFLLVLDLLECLQHNIAILQLSGGVVYFLSMFPYLLFNIIVRNCKYKRLIAGSSWQRAFSCNNWLRRFKYNSSIK